MLKETTRKDAPTYKYVDKCITEQIRSRDTSIILDDYHCNVSKITNNTVSGFTFVMGKKVTFRFRFEDLIFVDLI